MVLLLQLIVVLWLAVYLVVVLVVLVCWLAVLWLDGIFGYMGWLMAEVRLVWLVVSKDWARAS